MSKVECPARGGWGSVLVGTDRDGDGEVPVFSVCKECDGDGWVDEDES
jgi:hypothetical protein